MRFVLLLSFSLLPACTVNLLAPGQEGSRVPMSFRPGYSVPITTGGPRGIKITPGAVRARGSQIAAQAAITMDQRQASGTQVSGSFSLERNQGR